MPVIHIYGASGSGTSTLAKALQEKLKYTQLDTDDYFWEQTNPPFTTKRSAQDRIYLLKKELVQLSNVVVSGSLCGWGDRLIPLFDLVIRLVVPTDERISRLHKRELQRFGSRICDGGDMFEQHTEFMQWASQYDEGATSMRSKSMHDEWEKNIPCKHITLDATQSTQQLVETILISML